MNTDNVVRKAWGGAGAEWKGQRRGQWDICNIANNKRKILLLCQVGFIPIGDFFLFLSGLKPIKQKRLFNFTGF